MIRPAWRAARFGRATLLCVSACLGRRAGRRRPGPQTCWCDDRIRCWPLLGAASRGACLAGVCRAPLLPSCEPQARLLDRVRLLLQSRRHAVVLRRGPPSPRAAGGGGVAGIAACCAPSSRIRVASGQNYIRQCLRHSRRRLVHVTRDTRTSLWNECTCPSPKANPHIRTTLDLGGSGGSKAS